MDLTEIVSIGGIGGLHKVVGKRPNGLIVETLDASKKRFATSMNQKVSFLADISMYVNDGDIKLREVLVKLHDHVKGKHPIPAKDADNEKVKKYFLAVLPDFDQEKVYISDIRKLLNWYLILKEHTDLAELLKEEEKEAVETEETEGAEAKETKKIKTATKKEVAPKAKTPAPKTTGAKGAKAAAPRKTGGGG